MMSHFNDMVEAAADDSIACIKSGVGEWPAHVTIELSDSKTDGYGFVFDVRCFECNAMIREICGTTIDEFVDAHCGCATIFKRGDFVDLVLVAPDGERLSDVTINLINAMPPAFRCLVISVRTIANVGNAARIHLESGHDVMVLWKFLRLVAEAVA